MPAAAGIGAPSSSTVPAVGRDSARSMRIIVVLPEPFGPSTPSTAPTGTSRSTPATATVAPNTLRRPRTRIAGVCDPACAVVAVGVTEPAVTRSVPRQRFAETVRAHQTCRRLPGALGLQEDGLDVVDRAAQFGADGGIVGGSGVARAQVTDHARRVQPACFGVAADAIDGVVRVGCSRRLEKIAFQDDGAAFAAVGFLADALGMPGTFGGFRGDVSQLGLEFGQPCGRVRGDGEVVAAPVNHAEVQYPSVRQLPVPGDD